MVHQVADFPSPCGPVKGRWLAKVSPPTEGFVNQWDALPQKQEHVWGNGWNMNVDISWDISNQQ